MKYLYPSLRQGLVGAWCPSLGSTGYTLRDQSGYNNHGTLTNMDAGTDWVASGDGLALDFDGSNDYVDTPTLSMTNAVASLSMSLWVRRVGTFVNYGGLAVRGISSNDRYGFICGGPSLGTTQNIVVVMGSGSNTYGYGSITPFADTNWHHLAFAYNGNGATNADKIIAYVDGVRDSLTFSGTIPSLTSSNVGGMRFGADIPAVGYSACSLDDALIYTRGLSPSEFKLLSLRRGIAYETMPTRYHMRGTAGGGGGSFKAAWANNRNSILGAVVR